MTIIDKRKSGKNKSVDNRQRFVKRYKQHIKKSIEEDAAKGSITDSTKKRKATVSNKDLAEPEFSLDPKTGKSQRVLPGNKEYSAGDRIRKDNSSSGRGTGGSNSGGGEDEFSFVLSEEEFIEIYFSEMALPNFIKQSLKDTKKYKLVRSGYSKDGIPPRLDLLKTFKQAIARKVAAKAHKEETDHKSPFLDDIDMRYKHFTRKPFPIRHAKVFFLMDVSGSMGEYEKSMAKKFFVLLYLFLKREYDKVDVSFVRHTEEAKEVTEEKFFYSRESGGTIVSKGLAIINDIIDKDVKLHETNVYVAQASDGDNWYSDEAECEAELRSLLDKVQYFAYIQTESEERQLWKEDNDAEDLYDLYDKVAQDNPKLNIRKVNNPTEIYPVLKDLFKKEH